jgi:hypothetical protein
VGPWGSYYEVLGVEPSAPAEEIKRAFRREIAKYHPDKVQHLGPEFQEIAAVKTAELTQAYKTLSDDTLRADYDMQLGQWAAAPPPYPSEPAGQAEGGERRAEGGPPPADSDQGFRSQPAASYRVGTGELLRKAALQRFRHAVNQEFGQCEEPALAGFDVMCAPAKSGFLSRTVPPRLLGRVVDQVDAAAVQESWAMAMRLKKDDQRDACIFIMGPVVALPAELGRAINEQRRKPMPSGVKLVVVPVNTRTWAAHIPTDAPPRVIAFLGRLASGL